MWLETPPKTKKAKKELVTFGNLENHHRGIRSQKEEKGHAALSGGKVTSFHFCRGAITPKISLYAK